MGGGRGTKGETEKGDTCMNKQYQHCIQKKCLTFCLHINGSL